MCLIAFSWQPQARHLHLLANRDEFYARPTQPAHWWPDSPTIWAGRDQQAGGTWLGINRSGRFAALTNVREAQMSVGKRSRGELVTDFLTSSLSPQAYLAQVLSQGEQYAGFNLLLGDLAMDKDEGELWYGGNRAGGEARRLNAGSYGLSNAQLNTPWPKLTRLKQGLAQLDETNEASAFALLDDTTQATPESLPNTGVSPELELLLSSAFIHSSTYGTRAQTYLCIKDQQLDIIERSRGAQAELISTQRLQLILPSA
ncbi:NRDE family protein [Oceanisphaera sp. W20_SRM_FM3]|uniref:NRDE family protein n=1 Tax=Oceanisphaera sp. W20_SRM_FM3 TaxID=3240267 RepID=UPI003F9A1431